MRTVILTISVLSALLLGACGLKGDLYIEEPPAEATTDAESVEDSSIDETSSTDVPASN